MTAAPPPNERDAVAASVRRRRERRARAGTPTLANQLARVGVLGWIIVTPALLGVWLGGRLDHATGGGLVWRGGLLIAGLALGAWSAWRWMMRR